MSDFTVAVGVVVFLSWALLRLSRCCAHRHITTPRRDEEGAYVRCLGCGGADRRAAVGHGTARSTAGGGAAYGGNHPTIQQRRER